MITKLAWKNIWFNPLNTILSVILLTSSVAIITTLILVEKQFEEKFTSNIKDVDLVLGAQGSPLQLILSSVYQVDSPTGNINYDSAKVWMNNPYVEKAIPLAFGDNYRGYKILGTSHDYLVKYKAKLAEGKLFEKNFEVVVGSEIAQKLNLKIGDEFYGSHGDAEEGEEHQKADLTLDEPNMEITAVLLKIRNQMAKLTWQRVVPQNTKMQAASPAFEVNRLFGLFGIGVTALQYLAYGIMLISGISIFIALFNTLKECKAEFALMRVNGARRFQLLKVVMIESLLLCVVGFIFGTILGRVALSMLSNSSEEDFKMSFNPYEFLWQKEGALFLVTLFVGFIAALIPAVKAYNLNISKTLANA